MADPPSHVLNVQLRRTVAWLDQVLGYLHEGVVVIDEDHTVVYANETLGTLLGQHRLNLVGVPLASLLPAPPEQASPMESVLGRLHRLADGNPSHLGDLPLMTPSGIRWMALVATGMKRRRGLPRQVLLTLLDVTDQRVAEEQQRRHEEELEKLNAVLEERTRRRTYELEALYDLSLHLSTVRTNEDVMRLVLECQQGVLHRDVSAGLLVAERVQQLVLLLARPITDECLQSMHAHMTEALTQLAAAPFDPESISIRRIQLATYDPSRPAVSQLTSIFQVPLAVEGHAVGMLLSASGKQRRFVDNEVRFMYTLAAQGAAAVQRLEAGRAEERRRLARILQDLPGGVLVLDAERRVAFSNREASKLLRLLDVTDGSPLQRLGSAPIDGLLNEPGETVELEAGSGPPRLFSVSAVPSEGADSEVVLLVRDVTREREQQRVMALQERLAVVGQLAGGVAHDFNNLLNVILGYSELILARLAPEASLKADLMEIQKAGERAAVLTRQLLAFSRRQLLVPKVLDLNVVVADMEKLLRRLIGEHISLVTVLAPRLGRVKADPGQIEQVIMNLAVNARDAMPDGGRMTIETRDVEHDDTYARMHVGVKPGRFVMVAVSDTGIGMDAETRARIFEPFFTTKSHSKGTGLGLATVYGIVKQSGGHIWVYSEPGMGTTFKLYLPLAELAPEVPADPRPTRVVSGGTEHVLLVEDESELRSLVARLLKANGYLVTEAATGEDAVACCDAMPEAADLLLTDVVMPGMSGRELAHLLSRRWPDLRVLYMSGYTDDAIFRHGVLDAGVPFLQKPFTAEGLAMKVRQVLDAGRGNVRV
ncbi:MAG: ATP-binding protein [Candidatus Xenobia bacterium]